MRFTIVLALLCPFLSFSQQNRSKPPAPLSSVNSHLSSSPPSVIPQLSSLSIGDTLPVGILNAKGAWVSSSAGGGREGAPKLLLLDFFATWCTACIKELPKLNNLQQQYNGELQVVLVTYEPFEKVTELKKRNKVVAASALPVIASDTVLHRLFPHRLLLRF